MKYLISAAFICLFVACEPEIQDDLVIKQVSVIDVVKGETLPNRDVFIYNKKIRAIKPHRKHATAKKILDGKGLYVMPGLFDMLTYFRGGPSSISANHDLLMFYLAFGVTGILDLGGDICEEVKQWQSDIASDVLFGPDIFTAGTFLHQEATPWKGGIKISNAKSARQAIDSMKGQIQALSLQAYLSYNDCNDYQKVIAHGKSKSLPVIGPLVSDCNPKKLFEAGLNAVPGFDQFVPDDMISSERTLPDPSEAANLLKHASQHGVALISGYFKMVREASFDKEKYEGNPFRKYLDLDMRMAALENIERQGLALASSKEVRSHRARLSVIRQMFPLMRKSGVQVLVGSGSGYYNSPVPGISLHQELTYLAKAGFSAPYLVKSVTFDAARFLGVTREMGSVREGKYANLILLRDNPLHDIRHTQEIDWVIRKGRLYPWEGLYTGLIRQRQQSDIKKKTPELFSWLGNQILYTQP